MNKNRTENNFDGSKFTLETLKAVQVKLATFTKLPDYLVEWQGEWVKLYTDGKKVSVPYQRGAVLCSPQMVSVMRDRIPEAVERYRMQAFQLLPPLRVVVATEEERHALIMALL